ncbi:MAG: hydrolase 1, exosortase A system-associated [Pseudomonadota bacterium]
MSERVLQFACEGEQLLGILHPGAADARTGVLVIVGGPQYRVGSHRQFVLLARTLAQHGIPTLRFDYRGMGDASGASRDFEQIDADIRAACDAFLAATPGLQRIVLWGLCDAASAALFYAPRDARIGALVLLNPWLRQAQAQARTMVQHYYKKRLFSRDLWRKLFTGQFDLRGSVRSLWQTLQQARQRAPTAAAANAAPPSLSARMATGWRQFTGPKLLVLSGDDLVAKEFESVSSSDPLWRGLREQAGVQSHRMADANHTFARAVWRDEVAAITVRFVNDLR